MRRMECMMLSKKIHVYINAYDRTPLKYRSCDCINQFNIKIQFTN